MSLKVENLEKNMMKLTIEVEASEFEKAIEKAYNKQKNQINIPGFRKGKAPRATIEKMYGAGIFYEEAANIIIPEAYSKALDEYEGKEIVSQPTIDVVQLEAGKPFIFTAEVAVKPDVTLGQYKGVEIDKVEATVSAEEVDAEIKREQEANAREVVVEDRAVKDGDITVIDFEGFVGGEPFAGGKGEDYPLTIGSGAFIPGFEEQLIGAEIGKELEVKVTFPESYHADELAGKDATFVCTVKEIKEKELPELDDEFASEVSEFDTMAEYRASVEKKLAERKEAEVKNAKENAAIEAVIANATMDIPEAMVEFQQRQMLEEFAQRLQMQGLSLEQYFQFTGQTAATMLDQVKPQALNRIKSSLVLEAVVAEEKIEASEEDFTAEVAKMAEQYKMEVAKIEEMLGEGGKKQIMNDLAIAKAVEFIVANAVEK